MYSKSTVMFLVLSASLLTALTATATTFAVPVFADNKKCKNNDNNNCNDTHKTQKIDQENKCRIENKNKDHSGHNENLNELACVNIGANLKDTLFLFGLDGLTPTSTAQNGQ